jgi:hypothetical protein
MRLCSSQIANVVAPDGSYTGDAWTSCRDNIRNCSSEQMDVLHGQPYLTSLPCLANVFRFGSRQATVLTSCDAEIAVCAACRVQGGTHQGAEGCRR